MSDEPVFLDADIMNADWLRSMSWDLWTTDADGQYSLVTTLPQLLEVLDVANAEPAAQHAALEHFMTLPAAIPMPVPLRQSVLGVLDANRPKGTGKFTVHKTVTRDAEGRISGIAEEHVPDEGG